MDIRLTGTFFTRSPLSHIGESISTTSYLVQEPVLQEEGGTEEVFVYSGNAWRGQLRDLSAAYLLDRLGGVQIPIDAFHLLFSGGKIGGDQQVDIARLVRTRKTIVHTGLFGGGLGNQIMEGQMRVGNIYPVCREARRLLPPELAVGDLPSYRSMTMEKSFSRKDDSKNLNLSKYIHGAALPSLEGNTADRSGPADQMRMTCELLIPGVTLATRIDLLDVSEVQLGCLVAALSYFSRSPFIGGQSNRGHGLVALEYRLTDTNSGASQPFLRIDDASVARLAPPAESAKQAYDEQLLDLYDRMIDRDSGEIKHLLEA